MLTLLEFLVSPIILPTIEEASKKYLRHDCNITDSKNEGPLRLVIQSLHKEFIPQLGDKNNAPLIGLLDGPIMDEIDKAFSHHMSEFMCHYGAIDPKEVVIYSSSFQAYHKELKETVGKVIQKDMLPYCKKSSEGARQRATLLNLCIKLRWTSLGFKPSLNKKSYPPLSLTTLPPPLSISVIGSMMLHWEASKVSKYMKVPRGEPKIKEVCFFAQAVGEVSMTKAGLVYTHAKQPTDV
jgi:hypothetical protein